MSIDSIAANIETAIARGDSAQQLLELILAQFSAQTGTIHRLCSDTGLLTMIAHVGIPPVIIDKVREIPIGKGIAGAAAEQRKPVTICNIKTDTSGVVRPGASATGAEGAIAVPMLENGELRGTLGVGKNTEYTWSPEETRALEQVATLLCKIA